MNADSDFGKVHALVGDMGLHTVCKSAKCPNMHECWGHGTATIMLLGNECTRACRFCAIPAGRPKHHDPDEPRRVAEAAQKMNLSHVVLTSVARDDLPDGGSGIFAETIIAIRSRLPYASVEILTPDFQGIMAQLNTVLAARPDVFNHNLETVKRLQAASRPQASDGRSLAVLRAAAESENPPGVRLLTVGQYLQPTRAHRPVSRYVTPEQFAEYDRQARAIGFHGVASGPMVRSSYKAEELLQAAREATLRTTT